MLLVRSSSLSFNSLCALKKWIKSQVFPLGKTSPQRVNLFAMTTTQTFTMSFSSNSASFLKSEKQPPPRRLEEGASRKLRRSRRRLNRRLRRQLHTVVTAKKTTDENHDSDSDDDAFIQLLLNNNNDDKNDNKSRYNCHSLEDFLDRKPLSKIDFNRRRFKVFSKFPNDNRLIFALSGELQTRNGFEGHTARFRQIPDFMYLTGINEPDYFLLSTCGPKETDVKTVILCPRKTEQMKVWMGAGRSAEEIQETTMCDRCFYVDEIDDAMEYLNNGSNSNSNSTEKNNNEGEETSSNNKGRRAFKIAHSTVVFVAPELDDVALKKRLQSNDAFVKSKTWGPSISANATSSNFRFDYVALPDKIACQRAIKTKEEIERIKRANDGSSDAHIAMWQFSKPNETYEFQLEAEFIAASTKRNLRELGYPCIVGSGKNAAILHYEENSALCKEKEIVLVDAGAECEGYTADITRCFPTDGKFTEDAKLLYNVVLDVQVDAIERYTNGALWADIARQAKLKTIEGLQKKLGVVNADADLNEALEAGISEVLLPHALGHYLGLQVHDVGPNAGTPLPVVLEVGNVITCEPGVYFVEALYEKALANEKQKKFLNRENIERFAKVGGVRIEDNIWVTERGPVNLTRCPKTVEDVEAACASA